VKEWLLLIGSWQEPAETSDWWQKALTAEIGQLSPSPQRKGSSSTVNIHRKRRSASLGPALA
jgi:hypothetical protein